MGSPPRVRGKVLADGVGVLLLGITPVRAGKSSITGTSGIWGKDHPRACGEKDLFLQHPTIPLGSPPRVRGKGPGSRVVTVPTGITPARAGKRHTHTTPDGATGDHPRACGEKKEWMHQDISQVGSPPRVRGKEPTPAAPTEEPGITPAHAGKRWILTPPPLCPRDHPRTRGEKDYQGLLVGDALGSPPHTRGKGHGGGCKLGHLGITPAHAGKRPAPSPWQE